MEKRGDPDFLPLKIQATFLHQFNPAEVCSISFSIRMEPLYCCNPWYHGVWVIPLILRIGRVEDYPQID
ncbi:hypothetical protein BBR01nite_15810 [Brevibacillus brevis]|nr:hypothetical protein BBR01nite_15810 [Brevibacillus brevis]